MGVPTGGRHQHPTTARAGVSGRSLTPRAFVSASGKGAPRAPVRGRLSGRPRAGSPGSAHPQHPPPLTGPPGIPLRGSPDRRRPRYIVSCPGAGATLYPAPPPAAAACGREAPDTRGPRVCAPRPPRPGGFHVPLRETETGDPSPRLCRVAWAGGAVGGDCVSVVTPQAWFKSNPPPCQRKWWCRVLFKTRGAEGVNREREPRAGGRPPARRPRVALAAGPGGAGGELGRRSPWGAGAALWEKPACEGVFHAVRDTALSLPVTLVAVLRAFKSCVSPPRPRPAPPPPGSEGCAPP